MQNETVKVELVVKFKDGLRVRSFKEGTEAGALRATGDGDLSRVQEVVLRHGLQFAPLLQTPIGELAKLEARAADRSGVVQPDLAGMMKVVSSDHSLSELLRIGQELQSLDAVEFAEVEERMVIPPTDYAPTTPGLEGSQGHLMPNPGLDFNQAYTRGATGAGVKLSDCEYGWDHQHEDLVDQGIVPEPGQTPSGFVAANGWDDHGTAALGVSAAGRNGYGCNGGAPDASFATFPEHTVQDGSRRAACIANALSASAAGDVVLLEMQTSGAGGGFGPAELNQSVWTVVKVGTDADVVVVAAAGNGAQNLDSSAYAPYLARGDSGAIIVGAGSNDLSHSPLGFSTYGTRVDVQGWGTSVFTLGYGGFATYGGDPRQSYTATFNGTSSGSAVIAACVTALQSFAIAQTGAPLGPHEMRTLLIQTGIPQGGSQLIGPLPDMNAAMDTMDCSTSNYCIGAINGNLTFGSMSATGTTSIAANDLVLHASGCSPNNFGIFIFGPQPDMLPRGNGFICVGGAWRLQVVPTLANGSASLPFDNAPSPGSPYVVTAGTDWHFQLWYRDGTGYNFTDGLKVAFCP